jgi:hypothetical protein
MKLLNCSGHKRRASTYIEHEDLLEIGNLLACREIVTPYRARDDKFVCHCDGALLLDKKLA